MTEASSYRRRARITQTPLPERVLAKFGGPQARPRLVQAYDPRRGWNSDRNKEAVTMELLLELRAAGVTLIEGKWRSHRARVNLSTVFAAQE
jgi:hypothetical protein